MWHRPTRSLDVEVARSVPPSFKIAALALLAVALTPVVLLSTIVGAVDSNMTILTREPMSPASPPALRPPFDTTTPPPPWPPRSSPSSPPPPRPLPLFPPWSPPPPRSSPSSPPAPRSSILLPPPPCLSPSSPPLPPTLPLPPLCGPNFWCAADRSCVDARCVATSDVVRYVPFASNPGLHVNLSRPSPRRAIADLLFNTGNPIFRAVGLAYQLYWNHSSSTLLSIAHGGVDSAWDSIDSLYVRSQDELVRDRTNVSQTLYDVVTGNHVPFGELRFRSTANSYSRYPSVRVTMLTSTDGPSTWPESRAYLFNANKTGVLLARFAFDVAPTSSESSAVVVVVGAACGSIVNQGTQDYSNQLPFQADTTDLSWVSGATNAWAKHALIPVVDGRAPALHFVGQV